MSQVNYSSSLPHLDSRFTAMHAHVCQNKYIRGTSSHQNDGSTDCEARHKTLLLLLLLLLLCCCDIHVRRIIRVPPVHIFTITPTNTRIEYSYKQQYSVSNRVTLVVCSGNASSPS